MEAKKTPKADLEKRRGLYLEIGLVVILAAALVAFNIKSYDKEEKVVNTRTAESEIDVEILNTQEEETPPPPPEEPEVVATDLNVVENDAQDIEEVGIINAGDDANKGAERITNVVVEEEVQEEEDEVFIVVEEDPEFPGGIDSLYAFIRRNLHYPEEAWNNKIEGTVYVTFSVEKDGSISNVKLLRDIGGGCGAEAVRVVKLMPKWKPGKQRGIPVRTQFNLPIKFKMSAN